eukprot:TRINITY_DN33340_c0_g1_i1.p1 TRINITY_DN33340_c0_g1~~TRINITY_DN33340_c0_g1_i1.p1  ORF type:complete len:500 (+),score=153.46 TRINITY_DN33340_c0_g1_i1:58-1500(+)
MPPGLDPQELYRQAYARAYESKLPYDDPSNPFELTRGGTERMHKGVSFRIQCTGDFLDLRTLADEMDGWRLKHREPGIWAWDRPPPDDQTSFNMLKVFAIFPDVLPWVMYDALHDPAYRWEWDPNMAEGYNITQLDLNNDVGYYELKLPKAFSNRDFCNARSWRNINGSEFIVMNSSKPHPSCPPRKGIVRGWSFRSGYLVRPHGDAGCSLTSVSHSDPKGWIPAWLINQFLTSRAPQQMRSLRAAATKYRRWKDADPRRKGRPWVTPPQPWPRPQPDRTPQWALSTSEGRSFWPANTGPPALPPPSWYDEPGMLWFAEGAPLHSAEATETNRLVEAAQAAAAGRPGTPHAPAAHPGAPDAPAAPAALQGEGPLPMQPQRSSLKGARCVQSVRTVTAQVTPLTSGKAAAVVMGTLLAVLLVATAAVTLQWGGPGIVAAVPAAALIYGLAARCLVSRRSQLAVLRVTNAAMGAGRPPPTAV